MPQLCCSLAACILAWAQQLALSETSDAVHLALQESMSMQSWLVWD